MAAVDIQTGEILEGHLLSMVREWIGLNREDLMLMWETQDFKKLSPLE